MSVLSEIPRKQHTLTGSGRWFHLVTWLEQTTQWSIISRCTCVCAQSLNNVRLFETPWAVSYQTPLSMGILQQRILEWVAMHTSRGFSQPKDQSRVSCISCIAGRFFTAELLSHWGNPYYTILYYIISSYYIKCQIWLYIYHCYLTFLGYETLFLRFSQIWAYSVIY